MNTTIRGRELLTKEQRLNFMRFPEDEWSIGSYYTFSKDDIEIIKKHRKEENQLGFAIQLSVLRYPGWPYILNKNVSDSVVKYIAKQINVIPKSLKYYSLRDSTYRDHIKEIRDKYGYISFSHKEYNITLKYLINLALESDDTLFLIDRSICFLRENKIILPAITTIESLVWEAKEKAETTVIETIIGSLSDEQRERLDEVVFSTSDKLKNKTVLGWLKDPVGRPCSDNFLKVIEKLEYIRELGLDSIQLNKLYANKINQRI